MGLHTGAALYMPHRATLNDEIFVGGRKSDRETGNAKGSEKGMGRTKPH